MATHEQESEINKELYYGQGFPFFGNLSDDSGKIGSGERENMNNSPDQQNPLAKDPEGLVEMLYIQRSVNENDRHSGQIAFPGGRCDDQENDKEASEREALEEVGLDLKDNQRFVYIGKLDQNFFCYKKKGKDCWIGVN